MNEIKGCNSRVSTPNIQRLALFMLLTFLCFPVMLHSAPPQSAQQAQQTIQNLNAISAAADRIKASANGIVIKKQYCSPGTGNPVKQSTYAEISRYRGQLNQLVPELRNIDSTVNWMQARPVVWGKLVPQGTGAKIKDVRRKIQKAGSILSKKEAALKKAPTKNCMFKAVDYQAVNIPSIPDYVCTQKEKRALIDSAQKAVKAADENVRKAQADADRYIRTVGANALFQKAKQVYEDHKRVLHNARVALDAASNKLKVVRCDENGVLVSVPGLDKSVLKTPPLVRPVTGACAACKPEQKTYNSTVKSLTKLRNKIDKLVRRHGGPKGKVSPKAAENYKLLMKAWNAKHALVEEYGRSLNSCIEAKCGSDTGEPSIGANTTPDAPETIGGLATGGSGDWVIVSEDDKKTSPSTPTLPPAAPAPPPAAPTSPPPPAAPPASQPVDPVLKFVVKELTRGIKHGANSSDLCLAMDYVVAHSFYADLLGSILTVQVTDPNGRTSQESMVISNRTRSLMALRIYVYGIHLIRLMTLVTVDGQVWALSGKTSTEVNVGASEPNKNLCK